MNSAREVVLLLGKTGAGKSTLGNRLLGSHDNKPFTASSSTKSKTKKCEVATLTINGKEYDLVDTPGLFDNQGVDPLKEIREFVNQCAGGVRAILFVLGAVRITVEEENALKTIHKFLGKDATDNFIVVFSKAEPEHVKGEQKIDWEEIDVLRDFIERIKRRYCVAPLRRYFDEEERKAKNQRRLAEEQRKKKEEEEKKKKEHDDKIRAVAEKKARDEMEKLKQEMERERERDRQERERERERERREQRGRGKGRDESGRENATHTSNVAVASKKEDTNVVTSVSKKEVTTKVACDPKKEDTSKVSNASNKVDEKLNKVEVIGTLAAIGATTGSVLPGFGTAAGAAIGATIGATVGAVMSLLPD
ncbi:AIG1 family-domain-containing protein [Rhizophagus diaphanus]|nr:AIG1 family-domain-containing protein [Rhizophagus diaphanus] [Rhizophagus sp. MUCL 43196]